MSVCGAPSSFARSSQPPTAAPCSSRHRAGPPLRPARRRKGVARRAGPEPGRLAPPFVRRRCHGRHSEPCTHCRGSHSGPCARRLGHGPRAPQAGEADVLEQGPPRLDPFLASRALLEGRPCLPARERRAAAAGAPGRRARPPVRGGERAAVDAGRRPRPSPPCRAQAVPLWPRAADVNGKKRDESSRELLGRRARCRVCRRLSVNIV